MSAVASAPPEPWRRAGSDVASALGVDPHRGLSGDEAAERLRDAGRNELATAAPVPAWRRLLAQLARRLVR